MVSVGRAIRVVVKAPSSVANLGPGFDILATALPCFSDVVEVTVRRGSDGVRVESKGFGIPSGSSNAAHAVAERFVEEFRIRHAEIVLRIRKGIPPSLGLGSSGASSAAAAYALALAFGTGLSVKELLHIASAGEEHVAGTPHYDNISASLLGGIAVVDPSEPIAYRLEPPPSLWFTVIYPKNHVVESKTLKARQKLPQELKMDEVVHQLSAVAMLIHGIHSNDYGLIGRAVSIDNIAEPYRAEAIPHYEELKVRAYELGALGFNVSGAGPSVFSVTDTRMKAVRIGEALTSLLNSRSIDSGFCVAAPSNHGARALEIRRV